MITRRNIRAKAMQALYAIKNSEANLDKETQIRHGILLFKENIEESAALFTFLLSYLMETGLYVKKDAKRRASKFLASQADKEVNIKLSESPILQALLEDKDFQKQQEKFHTESKIDEDQIRKSFKQLTEQEEYSQYLKNDNTGKAEDLEILKVIWTRLMLGQEDFENNLADDWDKWEDDKPLMSILFENFLKNPKTVRFKRFISKDKEEYAEELIRTVLDKEDYLTDLIEPRLKNWELERIPLIDVELLKMGISEFLYFPSIPVKVTINEYIDLAKNYSTEQSGQFVNGVLDNIQKDLKKENKIRKIARV